MAKLAAVAGVVLVVVIALYLRFAFDDTPIGDDRIAFVAMTRESSTLWTVDSDGSDARQLIDLEVTGEFGPPSWSPDGRQIVFSTGDIHKVRAGSDLALGNSQTPMRLKPARSFRGMGR